MNFKAMHLWLKLGSAFLLCLVYYQIGYELERPQFWLLFSLYSLAFGLSIYLYKSGIKLKYLIGLSFLFKFIFLFSVPELSQDFYRFIWDGMLNVKGYNPYLHLPIDLIHLEFMKDQYFNRMLYEKMGNLNASNYSTYPPIAQLFYSFSYAISGNDLMQNIIVLRLVNIIAEAGLTVFGLKILSDLKRPKSQILFFILNPLVILESTFSLHFEVVMLFFLVLSLYYLYRSKIYMSALGLAGAVVSKMLPLMFLPILFPYFNKKSNTFNRHQILNYLKYILDLVLGIILFYFGFWNDDLFVKSSKTLSLYFSSFEFNAGLYYVLRWIGFKWSGYNMIDVIGTGLSILSLIFILFLSLKHKRIEFQKLISYMLFASTAYYLFSTTIHPWYIMLPLLLSVFTRYNYMLIWSWLIFLSYSAYRLEVVEENFWLLGIQYTAILSIIGYEVISKRKLVS
ncbi:glycosyltransferase ArnT-like protein [Psychroflexus sediminis]|uniref:Mannosyltransferase related to Gpi18 n=1 Tax=Psychroflexus sediminis TaxID=470826 RepID=A0A1G7Y1D4_9FLAO|nr:glycosyltransferase ArnT-like protein [Psychroflexus sediminis]SDG90249.1 hypothetical protein SAMN04488027_11075 [Psychroflexus sediminis]